MGKIGRAWQLMKMSLRIIRKDKEILIFPVLSGLVTILILASFFIGIFLTMGFDGTNEISNWVFYTFFIAFYFVAFFTGIFFNACIIGCAMIRMNGGDPAVRDGLRIAGQNIGRIFLWAVIAATVGLIIRAIQERVGFIGKLIIGAIGIAWTIVTYFVVPVLIYEKLGPWDAVKKSASLFKKTWGETIVGNLGMGLVFGLLMIPAFVMMFAGIAVFFSAGLAAMIALVALGIIYLLVIAVVWSAAETILVAALYRYATTGKISEEFQGFTFDRPFVS